MHLLAHRGFWTPGYPKNSEKALTDALDRGWGVETDIRDSLGKLVISHDLPTANSSSFEQFLENISVLRRDNTLALNIKSDGLATILKKVLMKSEMYDYFVFDMSIPDTMSYIDLNIPFLTRQSEYELSPSFYNDSAGIWLDGFNSEWYTMDIIKKAFDDEKVVAIVSPELHGRKHLALWERLKEAGIHKYDRFFLCTDFPDLAEQYFDD